MHIPSSSSRAATVQLLRQTCRFSKEAVLDRNLVQLFLNPNFVEAADLVSMGAGTADLDEINATEIGGIEMATTESYSHCWPIPPQVDENQAIDIRVQWGSEAAASTDTQTPTVTYQAVTMGTSTWVAPATAIDTAIVVQADLGADIFMNSSWGQIAAATAGIQALVPGDDFINFKVLMTLSTLTAAWVVGAQIRYSRKYV